MSQQSTKYRFRLPRWLATAIRPCLTVLAVAVYPVIFLFTHNVAELSIAQIRLPLIIMAMLGLGLLLFLRLLCQHSGAAVLLAQISLLLGTYYRPLESLIRQQWAAIRYWHLAPTLALAVLILAWTSRQLSDTWRLRISQISRNVAIVFGVLLLLNLVQAVPVFSKQLWANLSDVSVSTASDDGQFVQTTVRPNFYYIILDEYSNFDSIRERYNFDNTPFLEFLRQQGFNVSLTSRNATTATNIEVTNIMEMRAAVSGSTPTEQRVSSYKNGTLLKFFKGLGYQTVVLSTVWPGLLEGDITYRYGVLSNLTDGHGQTLLSLIIKSSILHPLLSYASSSAGFISASFDFLGSFADTREPVFVFAHMRCPHQPFLFDADGKPVPPEHHDNWQDERYYLGQFVYTTRRITETLKTILQRDPAAVIILQSDHSARDHEFVAGRTKHKLPAEQVTSILNAVYLGGAELDIEGLSGLETSLLVYAELFGPDLPVRGEAP